MRNQLKRFWHDEIVVGVIQEATSLNEDPKEILAIIGKLVSQRGSQDIKDAEYRLKLISLITRDSESSD